MASSSYRMVIHHHVIAAWTLPGGEIADAADDVAKNAARFARDYLITGGHVRTGTLLRSIQWSRAKPTGVYSCRANASANAKHAVWVHEGTLAVAPIRPNTRTFLKLPPRPPYANPVYKRQVAGQAPKPYLRTGLRLAMAQFRAGG